MLRFAMTAALISTLIACVPPTQIQPVLSNSVGLEALEELGEIKRAPVQVGMVIAEDVRNLTLTAEYQHALYSIPVGRALAAKIIKLASYQFEDIIILGSTDASAPIVLSISTPHEKPNLSVSVTQQVLNDRYEALVQINLMLQAHLMENGKEIWTGTARGAQYTFNGGFAGTSGIDLSRNLSDAVDQATDRLIADLMKQVRRSEPLSALYQ
jgi:hypothetical protein